ncbi:MAG: hypothetical protein IJG32_09285 [Selenomonadaceae bacterium]|nr:hypothetical protein [Selenomonadaceae bacterium]
MSEPKTKDNFSSRNDNFKKMLEDFDSMVKEVREYLILAQKRKYELDRYNQILTTILINIVVVTIYHFLTR